VIPDSAAVFWMLVAFVVTFAVTRVITNLIRRGRGPFRDMAVGGVQPSNDRVQPIELRVDN